MKRPVSFLILVGLVMQMTDARCKRCQEKKVGVVDIIQAGHGDRYQVFVFLPFALF